MMDQNEIEAWMEILREMEILEVYRRIYPSVADELKKFYS